MKIVVYKWTMLISNKEILFTNLDIYFWKTLLFFHSLNHSNKCSMLNQMFDNFCKIVFAHRIHFHFWEILHEISISPEIRNKNESTALLPHYACEWCIHSGYHLFFFYKRTHYFLTFFFFLISRPPIRIVDSM